MTKVLVVGPVSVGKSCVVDRLRGYDFLPDHRATLDVDVNPAAITHTLPNATASKRFALDVWDVPSQVDPVVLHRVYGREAAGALLVVDATNRHSLDEALKWRQALQHCVRRSNLPIPVILAVNKMDLVTKGMPAGFLPSDLDNYCRIHSIAGWFLVSAKTADGIDASFKKLIDVTTQDALVTPVSRPPWSLGLCDCASEPRVCADVCLCFPCNMGRQWNSVKGSENSLSVPVCLATFLGAPCVSCWLRSKVVERYGMNESTGCAFATGLFCLVCSGVQTYYELNVRGTFPGSTLPRRCWGPQPQAMSHFVGGNYRLQN